MTQSITVCYDSITVDEIILKDIEQNLGRSFSSQTNLGSDYFLAASLASSTFLSELYSWLKHQIC